MAASEQTIIVDDIQFAADHPEEPQGSDPNNSTVNRPEQSKDESKAGSHEKSSSESPGLSTDKTDVDIRRHLAAYLVRIKDRLSADEISAVDMDYLVAYDDFETEAIHKTAREIGKKYNVPSKKNAALHKMIKDRVGADINAVAESEVQDALAQINMANPVEFM